ncbi:hypothetical protein ACJ72_05444 [Emergomyces africanus]|uniref:Extracellular membrane protein CFEM domain-containing protein n=1 Tax=Emergomyces africanus TaxID=1955775 RepID=A0A1B7NTY2_9EURO|nr:hypothetical protein ACJ72_05444 [Emergomyces africanus]
MQFTNKFVALALLLAPLALAAPANNVPPADVVSAASNEGTGPADDSSLSRCTPSTYDCRCNAGGISCWISVCDALGKWKKSANCRDRKSPSSPPTCRDGTDGTAFCL